MLHSAQCATQGARGASPHPSASSLSLSVGTSWVGVPPPPPTGTGVTVQQLLHTPYLAVRSARISALHVVGALDRVKHDPFCIQVRPPLAAVFLFWGQKFRACEWRPAFRLLGPSSGVWRFGILCAVGAPAAFPDRAAGGGAGAQRRALPGLQPPAGVPAGAPLLFRGKFPPPHHPKERRSPLPL